MLRLDGTASAVPEKVIDPKIFSPRTPYFQKTSYKPWFSLRNGTVVVVDDPAETVATAYRVRAKNLIYLRN